MNMRIKHRFVFDKRDNNFDISSFLDKESIKWEYSDPYTIFELFEDQDSFDMIVKSLEPYGVVRNSPEAIYTREEIEAARWLTVRSSWRSLYPHPIDDFGFWCTTYDATAFCLKAKENDGSLYWCGSGLVQKESFILAKEPN